MKQNSNKTAMEEFKDDINLGENVVKVLKGIYDPEIPVDIYELGLIYDVMINEANEVKVLMTLTSPNCPVAETLPREVEEKISKINYNNPLYLRVNHSVAKASAAMTNNQTQSIKGVLRTTAFSMA